MKFNASDLNMFYTCPNMWRLIRIEKASGIPRDESLMLLGKNIHIIIQDYFSNISEKPTEKEIKKVASRCFETGFDPYLKRFSRSAKQMIQNFIEFEISRLKKGNYKPLFVEKKLEDEYFRGVIDFYDSDGIVIDWKTGRQVSITPEMRRQGKIYELLLKHNGFKVKKVYFVTLRNGRVLEMPYTSDSWLISEVNRMVRMYERGMYPKNKSGICKNCPVQLECELESLKLWDRRVI